MINSVTLVGRLTKDPVFDTVGEGISRCRFTLACDRKYAKDTADFIPCIVWRQSADFISKYARKGDTVGVVGSIQTGSYEGKNGKVYTTEVSGDRAVLLKSENHEEVIVQKHKDFEPVKESPMFEGIKADDLPFY